LIEQKSLATIVGAGATPQGELPGLSPDEIAVDAARLAIADAGIDKSQIDGLITCKAYGNFGIDSDIARLLGLNAAYSATLDYGTCNFSLHLAIMAIQSGMASCVLLLYGTAQRSMGNKFSHVVSTGVYGEGDYGFVNIAGPAAMGMRRYMHEFGLTEEKLSTISRTFRKNASMNPLAIRGKPMTLDEYLAEPYIVRPMRRPDICMISDGGAGLVVCHPDVAARISPAAVPVQVVGMAQAGGQRSFQNAGQLSRPWISTAAHRLREKYGITPDDIDVLFIQDPTSLWVLQMLEAYGFCGRGEAGDFIQDGRIEIGGELPLNTNGGQLAESYMWGWLHLVEAVRQLRGECGPRQVAGARVAQHCSTKAFDRAATSVLATW
jgi:acetyl-CoA acetyltransferase